MMRKCGYCDKQDVISDMLGVCLECAKDLEDIVGCKICDYCAKHQIHVGKNHNYNFDECWKCMETVV